MCVNNINKIKFFFIKFFKKEKEKRPARLRTANLREVSRFETSKKKSWSWSDTRLFLFYDFDSAEPPERENLSFLTIILTKI